MAYTYITYTAAKAQLAARLHDSTNVSFTDTGTYPELEVYMKEALRLWQVLTAYWREQDTFSTVANTIFYDLTSVLTTRAFTIYDQEIIAEMQYHLLEPATPTLWSGTEQFTLDDLTIALQRRRDQFISETGCNITRSVDATAASRATLAESIIDVRRVAWYSAGAVYTPLTREDEWALQAYNSAWDTAAVPSAYSIAATPPTTLQLAPPPAAAGSIEVLSVRSGATLDPTTPVLMGIPDDYCWVPKWGALADLLGKDGPGRDPTRSAYCQQRYQQGLEYARHAICLIQAQISGNQVPVASVQEMDMYNGSWQNDTAAVPTSMVSAGLNLVGFHPKPADVYTITLDVVRNTPIPAGGGALLQIGPEELNAILGYAEHLALFKYAGDEFEASMPLYENFMKVASNYIERIGAMVRYAQPLSLQSLREEVDHPRREVANG